METHPSVLAWRIPGTVEPGGLLSMVKNKLILNITVIIFSHPSHCSPRQYLHLHHHAITTPSFQEQFFNTVIEISSAQGPTHWE